MGGAPFGPFKHQVLAVASATLRSFPKCPIPLPKHWPKQRRLVRYVIEPKAALESIRQQILEVIQSAERMSIGDGSRDAPMSLGYESRIPSPAPEGWCHSCFQSLRRTLSRQCSVPDHSSGGPMRPGFTWMQRAPGRPPGRRAGCAPSRHRSGSAVPTLRRPRPPRSRRRRRHRAAGSTGRPSR